MREWMKALDTGRSMGEGRAVCCGGVAGAGSMSKVGKVGES